MRLSDFEVLTFDCYGTLIDWESGMLAALRPLADRAARTLTDEEILEAHARHESFQQAETPTMPYSRLLAVVAKRLTEEWRVEAPWDDCLGYGQSIRDWPAFPDTAAALHYLKQHYKLAILSNIDNESFAHSNRKLGVAFDAVFTAEDIGSYKPSPKNFEYMIEKLASMGIQRNHILHTAESLFHDHKAANDFGLASCWIHRRHGRAGFGATMNPGATPNFDFRFISMGAMAEAHRKENA
jgi:2-haloalkanoic acid dehalogenase type II